MRLLLVVALISVMCYGTHSLDSTYTNGPLYQGKCSGLLEPADSWMAEIPINSKYMQIVESIIASGLDWYGIQVQLIDSSDAKWFISQFNSKREKQAEKLSGLVDDSRNVTLAKVFVLPRLQSPHTAVVFIDEEGTNSWVTLIHESFPASMCPLGLWLAEISGASIETPREVIQPLDNTLVEEMHSRLRQVTPDVDSLLTRLKMMYTKRLWFYVHSFPLHISGAIGFARVVEIILDALVSIWLKRSAARDLIRRKLD